MRLIDADRLKRELHKLPMMSNWGEIFMPILIDEQPTIEERKTGRWIEEINRWLDPDIDNELALEKIRAIVYGAKDGGGA